MSARAYVIEFTGARGVGKSTLSALLVRALTNRGLACRRHGPERRTVVDAAAHRLQSIADEAWALAAFTPWRPTSARTLRRLVRNYRSLRRALANADAEGGVCSLDEGFWHLVLNLAIKTRGPDMEQIATTLSRRVREPDMLIFVTSSETRIAQRRQRRGNLGDRIHPTIGDEGRAGLLALQALLDTRSASNPAFGYVSLRNDDLVAAGTEVEHLADRIAAAVRT